MADALQVEPGSDDYNAQMAEKFTNQEPTADNGDTPDEVPVAPMPEGGYEKFYNKDTGEYNWQNHAKELQYRLENGGKTPEVTPEEQAEVEATTEDAASDIVLKAGLSPDDLRQQIESTGSLSEEAFAALEAQGLRRDLVQTYVDNMVYRLEQTQAEAMTYAGGQDEWDKLSAWAETNLPDSEKIRYNELLATPEWKVAIDALRMRRDTAIGEPNLIGGNNNLAGSQFGYRSKSEMKRDMSDPRYASDPAFRKEVMQKIQSATWDYDA
jgi:hypothetical protein